MAVLKQNVIRINFKRSVILLLNAICNIRQIFILHYNCLVFGSITRISPVICVIVIVAFVFFSVLFSVAHSVSI